MEGANHAHPHLEPVDFDQHIRLLPCLVLVVHFVFGLEVLGQLATIESLVGHDFGVQGAWVQVAVREDFGAPGRKLCLHEPRRAEVDGVAEQEGDRRVPLRVVELTALAENLPHAVEGHLETGVDVTRDVLERRIGGRV
jgi:hypothetical protein